MLVVKGWSQAIVIGWLWLPSPRHDQSGKQGQASVYLAIVAAPTAVTHLTITSLKVNWLLFQRDDNANWVAKHNTRNCCAPLRGGGGQIKWPYNSGRQAWQMLLCAEDCIDISLACQAWALEETYRTGDQMVSYRGWIKQLNSGTDNSAKKCVTWKIKIKKEEWQCFIDPTTATRIWWPANEGTLVSG